MAEGLCRGVRSARFGAAMVGALVAIAGTGVASAAPGRGRHVSVTVHEGTSFAVAASPDRRRIVIDMQNALWSLPFGGGRARKLTNNMTPATQPDFAPDGRTIFFQGYVGNNFHIWSVRPDGTGLRRLTSGPYDDREPRVSPDGRQLAFSSDRGGSYDIWVLDLAGGGITRLTATASQESQPAWSPDGRMLAFVVDNTRIDARDASGAVQTMFAAPAGTSIAAPSWAPDGVRIAYTVSDLPAGPLAPSTSAGLPNPKRSRLFVSGQPVSGGEDVFALRPRVAVRRRAALRRRREDPPPIARERLRERGPVHRDLLVPASPLRASPAQLPLDGAPARPRHRRSCALARRQAGRVRRAQRPVGDAHRRRAAPDHA